MAVKVKRERPDQRRHHRVTAPLYVGVGSHAVRAADWSLGGLRVEDFPGDLPSVGAEIKLALTLPFQGFDVSFEVAAEVVRSIPATRMFAVRFTAIGERERELMQHFIEELIRGSMVDVEDTIQRIDVPVTPASLEPDKPKLAKLPARRWPVKAVAMTSVYGLLGLAVFGYAALIGYANVFRMEVQSAVIAAPVEAVIAQSDGQVTWTAYKPGDTVKSGEVILNVLDNELEREIELAQIAVNERKAKLAYHKQRQIEELDKVRGFATVEMKNVQQTKIEIESLTAQLALANQQRDRVRKLHEKGFSTDARLEEAERQSVSLAKAIESRRVELSARVELAESNLGKRIYTGENILGAGAETEAMVKLAEHDVTLAQQRHASYVKQRTRAAVRAPFDGTILDLPRIDRGSVRRGDLIAVVEQRRDRYVDAFLTQDEILKVGTGDEAMIFVPALGETLKGRVEKIDRTSGFVREQDQRNAPGYGWRNANDRSAKVRIVFDEPAKVADVERYRAGLPVVVVFEQRSTSSLASLLRKKLAIGL